MAMTTLKIVDTGTGSFCVLREFDAWQWNYNERIILAQILGER
jgi:hypothetical protein